MYKKLQEEYQAYDKAKKELLATRPKAIRLTNYRPAQDNRYGEGVDILYDPSETMVELSVEKDRFVGRMRFFLESIPDIIMALQLFSDGNMDNLPEGWSVREINE